MRSTRKAVVNPLSAQPMNPIEQMLLTGLEGTRGEYDIGDRAERSLPDAPSNPREPEFRVPLRDHRAAYAAPADAAEYADHGINREAKDGGAARERKVLAMAVRRSDTGRKYPALRSFAPLPFLLPPCHSARAV